MTAPYYLADVDRGLAAIRAIAPQLVQIRLDRGVHAAGQRPTVDVTMYRPKNRMTFAISLRGAPPDAVTRKVTQFLGNVSPTQVAVLLTELLHLAVLNDIASWQLDDDTSRASPGGLQILDEASTTHPLLRDVRADIASALPGVASIVVQARFDVLPNGQDRRRVTVRCLADDELELAALDTAHFATTISTLLCGTPAEHVQRNRMRADTWAQQLGTDLEELPSLLHDLQLLAVHLPFRQIELNPATSTRAFWAARSPAATAGPPREAAAA